LLIDRHARLRKRPLTIARRSARGRAQDGDPAIDLAAENAAVRSSPSSASEVTVTITSIRGPGEGNCGAASSAASSAADSPGSGDRLLELVDDDHEAAQVLRDKDT